MLIRFEVTNFRSIKDTAEFSMEAYRPDKTNEENIVDVDNKSLLKVAAIYGANASGKTNLLRAMTLLRKLVTNSHHNTVENEMDHQPFLFDRQSRDEPTKFFVDFIQGGIRYQYELEYDYEGVLFEKLVYYPKGKPALIFSRKLLENDFDNPSGHQEAEYEYRFTTEKKQQNDISRLTPENVLYLSKAATSNLELIVEPFKWFKKGLKVFFPGRVPQMQLVRRTFEKHPKEFLSLIRMADLGIVDLTIDEEPIKELEDFFHSFFDDPPQINNTIQKNIMPTREIMETSHEIHGADGVERYPLQLSMESDGSLRFMESLVYWISLLKEGGILLADELDCRLHPMLVDALIYTIQEEKINRNDAQLIFTSHDGEMMDRNNLRRDQIWIAQRNPKDGITRYDSLLDFKPRNDAKLSKGYMEGRFGGIPFIKKWSIDI